MGILHQESLRRHNHAGRAVAALDRRLLHKDTLYPGELSRLLEPLYGEDLSPLQLTGQHQAGVHRLPVDNDRAGPAFSLSAALLRAAKMQILPQKINQPPLRLCVQSFRLSIQDKR